VKERHVRPPIPVIDNSGMPGGWNPPAAGNPPPTPSAPEMPPRPLSNSNYPIPPSPAVATPARQPLSTVPQQYSEYDNQPSQYYPPPTPPDTTRRAPAPYPKPNELLPTGTIDSDGWQQYQYPQTDSPAYPPAVPESPTTSGRRGGGRSDGLLNMGKKALGSRRS
jgi:hypothetical protein